MRYRFQWSHPSTLLFACLMVATTGCGRKPTPEQFAKWAEEFEASHVGSTIAHYNCSAGEREWDYVCIVSWTARPSARPSIPPPRRSGYKISFYYNDRPVWIERQMPVDGPVLSEAEAKVWLAKVSAPK